MAVLTSTPTDWTSYYALIQEFPLRPIRDRDEHEQAMVLVDRLIGQPDLAPAARAYFQVLVRLIEEYEDARIDLPPVSGRDMVCYLMEVHGLAQADLVEVFGTKSIVSEVLSGKRQLALSHIRRLSDYFGLPADVFIGPPSPPENQGRAS